MFCKHDYEILDKTMMESPYEQVVKAGNSGRSVKAGNTRIFFSKKLVILLKCTKCKDLLEKVYENPD